MKSRGMDSFSQRRTHHRLLNLCIVLFLTVLVGSLVLVLNAARHNTGTTGSQLTTSTHKNTSLLATAQAGVYVGNAEGALLKLDAAKGQLLWHYKTHGTSIPAPSTIAQGVVYIGSQDGTVYALNASTGAALWQFQTRGAILASPTVANGIVFVGSNDGYLYALNASGGTQLWRTYGGPANSAVTVGTAVVNNGIVYDSSSDNVNHSYLFALNASDGTQVWRISVTGQLFTDPQVVNNVIYIASSALSQQGGAYITDSYVYAFNVKDGSQLWRSDKIGNDILAPPTVANNVVYTGSQDTYLYALNATTGKQLWRVNTGAVISSSPAFAAGVIYTGGTITPVVNPPGSSSDTTASQGIITAMNASSGKLIWRIPVAGYIGTPLVPYQQVIYVGAGSNLVYALNTTSGGQIWRYQDTTVSSSFPAYNAPITVAP